MSARFVRSRRPRAAGLVTACVLVAGACGDAEPTPRTTAVQPLIGQPIPELEVTDLGRQPIDLAQYRGRNVLLNLWATWCIPCREEMPELEEVHRSYDSGDLSVVGLSIDHIDPALVVAFLEENDITYPTYLADGETLVETLRLDPGIPHTLLIDRDGIVRGYWRGRFHPSEPNTAALLESVVRGDV